MKKKPPLHEDPTVQRYLEAEAKTSKVATSLGHLLQQKLSQTAAFKTEPGMYNVTYAKKLRVCRDSLEESELLEIFMYKTHPRTVARVFKTIDEIVEDEVKAKRANKNSPLVWMSVAKAVGYSSSAPTNKINHLWTTILCSVGDGKNAYKLLGSIFRWRIILRAEEKEEIWLLYKTKREEI